MNEKTKVLSPKLDIVFQALFGEEGSERITKKFLEEILNKKIDQIELNKNPILRREKIDGKLGVLDVIAKINSSQNVDIEMQMAKKDNIRDRVLYYWSRLYIRSIKKKQDYETLEKSIVILISEEKIKGLEDLKGHTKWRIIENENRKIVLTDKLEIHIIQLEKINEDTDGISPGLLDWLMFLQNPESERVLKSMENNRELKEAREKLEQISQDEQMRQLAWWREKGILEENERIKQEKRIKEGQKKLDEGQKKLDEKEKAFKNKQKEFAKRLLKTGVSMKEVLEITGLTEKDIK